MGNTGINDHKVILPDGIFLIFHQKASGAVFYVKQFRKGMNVRLAVPVIFVFGMSNVKKLVYGRICRIMADRIN